MKTSKSLKAILFATMLATGSFNVTIPQNVQAATMKEMLNDKGNLFDANTLEELVQINKDSDIVKCLEFYEGYSKIENGKYLVYNDSAGNPTVGVGIQIRWSPELLEEFEEYGDNLKQITENIKNKIVNGEKVYCNIDIADRTFFNILQKCKNDVIIKMRETGMMFTEEQFNVLMELDYKYGISNLNKFFDFLQIGGKIEDFTIEVERTKPSNPEILARTYWRDSEKSGKYIVIVKPFGALQENFNWKKDDFNTAVANSMCKSTAGNMRRCIMRYMAYKNNVFAIISNVHGDYIDLETGETGNIVQFMRETIMELEQETLNIIENLSQEVSDGNEPIIELDECQKDFFETFVQDADLSTDYLEITSSEYLGILEDENSKFKEEANEIEETQKSDIATKEKDLQTKEDSNNVLLPIGIVSLVGIIAIKLKEKIKDCINKVLRRENKGDFSLKENVQSSSNKTIGDLTKENKKKQEEILRHYSNTINEIVNKGNYNVAQMWRRKQRLPSYKQVNGCNGNNGENNQSKYLEEGKDYR